MIDVYMQACVYIYIYVLYNGTYVYEGWLQMVKNLSAMWQTQVQSLGREDPLEKEMATHSSILAWKIPWTEESGGLQSRGLQRVRHN